MTYSHTNTSEYFSVGNATKPQSPFDDTILTHPYAIIGEDPVSFQASDRCVDHHTLLYPGLSAFHVECEWTASNSETSAATECASQFASRREFASDVSGSDDHSHQQTSLRYPYRVNSISISIVITPPAILSVLTPRSTAGRFSHSAPVERSNSTNPDLASLPLLCVRINIVSLSIQGFTPSSFSLSHRLNHQTVSRIGVSTRSQTQGPIEISAAHVPISCSHQRRTDFSPSSSSASSDRIFGTYIPCHRPSLARSKTPSAYVERSVVHLIQGWTYPYRPRFTCYIPLRFSSYFTEATSHRSTSFIRACSHVSLVATLAVNSQHRRVISYYPIFVPSFRGLVSALAHWLNHLFGSNQSTQYLS